MQSLARLSARLFSLVVIAVSGVGASFAADAGPVVELPKFVVTDSRELPQPESWRYATIPGFEILSNASDKATQRLIRDFDQFRQALGHIWPLPNRSSLPTSLIISGRGGKFDAFLPKERGVVNATASVFLKRGAHTAIAIDLQATTLNVLNVDAALDAERGTDSGLISVEHDKQLYREYIRFLLSQSEPRLPAWLEEGLSQIFMRVRFDRRSVEYARLEDPNLVSASAAAVAGLNAAAAAEDPEAAPMPGAPAEDRDFNSALQRRRLVPLELFFSVPHDAPEALNPLGNNVWAKQAYAFVHMCLYGRGGRFQKPFATFLQRLAREPLSEALFQDCFKMPYKTMLLELRSYCDFTDYQIKGVRAKKDGPDLIVPPAAIEFREATQAEIGRIKGEALVLAGNNHAARLELIAPYARGERDPQLLAALGVFEKNAGEDERARKLLEIAFAEKTTRADACIELARYRFADAVANPAGPSGSLSAEQTRHVLAPLLAARNHPPRLSALYETMGDTWLRSAARPTLEDAKAMIEGAQLFPARLKVVYQAAVVSLAAGELPPAHVLADHGIRYAPDAAARKRFEDFKATLPPLPADAAPATKR